MMWGAAEQAYQQPGQFGKFTGSWRFFPRASHLTLPDFHNLSLRYRQFEEALQHGNPVASPRPEDLIEQSGPSGTSSIPLKASGQHSGFRLRVTHHDTKISNAFLIKAARDSVSSTWIPSCQVFYQRSGDMKRPSFSRQRGRKRHRSYRHQGRIFPGVVRDISQMKDELKHREMNNIRYAGSSDLYASARFLTDHLMMTVLWTKYEGITSSGRSTTDLIATFDEKEPILTDWSNRCIHFKPAL